MKRMKWVGICLAAMLLVITACGNQEKEKNSGSDNSGNEKSYTVAISQIIEHPSLDATRNGFIAALKDAGIEEGKNLKIDFNSAQGEPSNSKTISQKIAGDKSDLALGIATLPSLHLSEDVKDKPVLFAAVTDPVGSGIISQMDAPGGNISGAADTNPEATAQLAEFVSKQFPNIKKLGLVIYEGEANAVVMAENADTQFGKYNIEIVRASITNSSEIKQAAESLIGRVDGFFVTLDNMVVSGVDPLIELANANDLPFFASDRDTVEKGAFAAVGFKYFDHGYQVGQMAVEILKNGKNPGEMKVTVPDKLDFIFNLKAAGEQGITVTDDMKAYVKDQAENIIE